MKKAKISFIDVEELACKVTGLDYDEIDADTEIIENELLEVYGIDLSGFTDLISILLPMIDYGESPLTKKKYKGFADIENQRWLIKTEV